MHDTQAAQRLRSVAAPARHGACMLAKIQARHLLHARKTHAAVGAVDAAPARLQAMAAPRV